MAPCSNCMWRQAHPPSQRCIVCLAAAPTDPSTTQPPVVVNGGVETCPVCQYTRLCSAPGNCQMCHRCEGNASKKYEKCVNCTYRPQMRPKSQPKPPHRLCYACYAHLVLQLGYCYVCKTCGVCTDKSGLCWVHATIKNKGTPPNVAAGDAPPSGPVALGAADQPQKGACSGCHGKPAETGGSLCKTCITAWEAAEG